MRFGNSTQLDSHHCYKTGQSLEIRAPRVSRWWRSAIDVMCAGCLMGILVRERVANRQCLLRYEGLKSAQASRYLIKPGCGGVQRPPRLLLRLARRATKMAFPHLQVRALGNPRRGLKV